MAFCFQEHALSLPWLTVVWACLPLWNALAFKIVSEIIKKTKIIGFGTALTIYIEPKWFRQGSKIRK
jgi:hypothetical protein